MKTRSRHHSKSRPLSRKAMLVAGAIGLLLIWQTTVISLAAGHGGDDNDLKAADYASVSQVAATTAAGQRLTTGDPAGAKVFASHALSVTPISADSLRDLGLAEQGLGNAQASSAIFSQAAALGWHDVPTQLWLAQAFLQQKDYGAAAQRLDAVLRINPDSPDVYKLLDQVLADPNASREIGDRLKLNPNWRVHYLGYVGDATPAELLARANMVTQLIDAGAPPKGDELAALLAGLIRTGQAPVARTLWLRAQNIKTGPVYDPGFQQIAGDDATPFEWGRVAALGASLSSDNGQLVAKTDGSASGTLMRQWLALPAGHHILSYAGEIPDVAREAFGWRIRCTGNWVTMLDTTRLSSPQPYGFDVPADCTGQLIELRVASSARAANSEARFKTLAIR